MKGKKRVNKGNIGVREEGDPPPLLYGVQWTRGEEKTYFDLSDEEKHLIKEYGAKVCGIDPGQKGALVLIHNKSATNWYHMPLDQNKRVDAHFLEKRIEGFVRQTNLFVCERIAPFAMGSKAAFSFGYDFSTLVHVLQRLCKKHDKRILYIRPHEWTKVMHEGQSKELKPKVKSEKVFSKLFNRGFAVQDKNFELHDGVIDAALLAEYGRRLLLKAVRE